MDVELLELGIDDFHKYSELFMTIFRSFGDYDGEFYNLRIGNSYKLVQRRDNVIYIYDYDSNGEIRYQIFEIDDGYKVGDMLFKEGRLSNVGKTKILCNDDTGNVESLVLCKNTLGKDSCFYGDIAAHTQYNSEADVRTISLYQHNANSKGYIYPYSFRNGPVQIIIQDGVLKRKPKSKVYFKVEYNKFDNPFGYKMTVLKDYGLDEFMKNGPYKLESDDSIFRYQKVLYKTKDGVGVTSFPFGKQYTLDDVKNYFNSLGFKKDVTSELIQMVNGVYLDMDFYSRIAECFKKLDKDSTIVLRKESDSNGQNN